MPGGMSHLATWPICRPEACEHAFSGCRHARLSVELSSLGYTAANMAGMIAKYFATSSAMENVVNAARVISSCLPISTISISFVGSESRSTVLPASFAADVPVFIATPTQSCQDGVTQLRRFARGRGAWRPKLSDT
jgi:hypothetical protein